jgi:S-adenosylmethionine hydrolase
MSLITLTTDTGTQDYLAAAIKGQLYASGKAVTIVDITHELSPYNFLQAAYICSSAFKYFAAETIHIVLVNVFDASPKHILVARHNNQFIICPDNGLLTMILDGMPEKLVKVAITNKPDSTLLSYTAQIAAITKVLAENRKIETVGSISTDIVVKNNLKPAIYTDYMEGQIIYIDKFENVIINITKTDFESACKGRAFKIVFKRDEIIETIHQHYADVKDGETLAFFNAAGYLEIAVNKGNASGLFGLKSISERSGDMTMQNRLFYQTVKIYFE